MIYLVTVKLAKNPDHNPHDKKTGPCPANPDALCTDVTGEHHTVLIVSGLPLEQILEVYSFTHITRVEYLDQGKV